MHIDCTIEGVTPLICHRFTDEAAMNATNGTRSSASAQERGTPQEQAEQFLYKGIDGETLIIPQPNLLRSIVDGGKFHKIGKAQVTTAKSSMLYSCVDIEGAEIPIKHKQPWTVDIRPVRIPSTGGRILAFRPRFDDWELKFVFELDDSMLKASVLRAIVDDAGKRIGLGDFRPSTKGPFGKFVVTHWKQN